MYRLVLSACMLCRLAVATTDGLCTRRWAARFWLCHQIVCKIHGLAIAYPDAIRFINGNGLDTIEEDLNFSLEELIIRGTSTS